MDTGIETGRDKFFIDYSFNLLKEKVETVFLNKNDNQLLSSFKITNTTSFKFKDNLLKVNFDVDRIKKILYRPFDFRYTYYDINLQRRASYNTMKQLMANNLALSTCRQQSTFNFQHILITNCIMERCTVSLQTKETGYVFPLYLYPETTAQQTIEPTTERTPNLNPEIVKQIAEKLGLTFTNEKISPTPPKEGLSQPGYVTANPVNYKLIKEMRDNLKDNPTEAEKVMWEYLRNKKTGYKIRRQHIIDNFITDFVCLSKKVVIEIDGKIHLQQKEYDELRTERLSELGYEVIRYTNEEVFDNPELVVLKIKEKLDSKIDPQNEEDTNSPPLEGLVEVFAPIDILDYIYAVLHSPTYREKYKEFLKIDFPRVPYPKNQDTFWQLVKLGGQIRQIHLLESPVVEQYITQYPADGDNVVDKPKYKDGKVYINKTQYFDNVPQVAWEFYIGGYQPAQKWLKDRKSRTLEFDDILHYQKIIVALYETHRLMKQIDSIEIE
ncbi:MAG: type ISP restriction/modification enzyme [Tenuifilaceae bacterium]|nr:type ISP restriction/modification enzyme [Tenuifilaceae bacterium]